MATARKKAKNEPNETDLAAYEAIENRSTLPCEYCGLEYDDFPSGYSYDEIYEMMWKGDEDPSMWRNKNRHGVLGLWHEMKQTMWQEHVDQCEQMEEGEEYDEDEMDEVLDDFIEDKDLEPVPF